MPSIVDVAIEEALAASQASYRSRGVRVVTELAARTRLSNHDPVLREALVTLFRALPERLSPDSTLHVRTADRAGGDIELVVEADWLPRDARAHSDLVELALSGLEKICRARFGRVDLTERADDGGHRRVLYLIPSLERVARWHPLRRS